jgi:uncharacterized phage protein gp47/JayE
MAGLTENGLEIKRLSEVRADMAAKAKATFGENTNTEPDSVMGQLIDVFAEQVADLWQGLEALNDSFDPNKAEGKQLDNACALVGITRQSATQSTYVPAFLCNWADLPVTVVVGSVITITDTGDQYTLDDAYTITSADDYNAAKLIVNNTPGDGELYRITIDATNCDFTTSNPVTESINTIHAELVDAINAATGTHGMVAVQDTFGQVYLYSDNSNNVHTITKSANLNFLEVAMPSTGATSVTEGVTAPVAFSKQELNNAVFGVNSTINILAGATGTQSETDDALRLRRARTLAIAGTATLDAIVAEVASLDGVTEANGYENTTGSTDADGRPGKSFEIVVLGGTDTGLCKV